VGTTSESTSSLPTNLYSLKPLIGLSAACAIAIFLLTITTAQTLPVLLPMVVMGSSIILFFLVLRFRQRGSIPFFEVGAFYVAVVAVYSLYPLIGFLVNGLTYSPLNDSRLFKTQPTSQEIAAIGWYYAVYLLSFIIVYLLARGRLPLEQRRFNPPSRITVAIIIVFYAIVKLFFLFLNFAYNLSYSTYGESYLVFQRLPLVLAQIAGQLKGATFTLELLILTALFQNYRKNRIFIYGYLAFIGLPTFFRIGSRTELLLLLFTAVILYHFLFKKIKLKLILLYGLIALTLFTILGILRSYSQANNLALNFNFFAYSSEFETIFANAYDLNHLKLEGKINDIPLSFYLADFLALFPQQIVPIEKINPSSWYVNKFYPNYAALGGGLALGASSESILSLGWIDLIWRGGILGFIFAQLHRYYLLSRPNFWTFTFYIWITVFSYQSFRTGTFSLLPLAFYQFIPFMLGVKIVAALVKRRLKLNRLATHRRLH
jgi:hypothetical protein